MKCEIEKYKQKKNIVTFHVTDFNWFHISFHISLKVVKILHVMVKILHVNHPNLPAMTTKQVHKLIYWG